jgi:hypothetical protein
MSLVCVLLVIFWLIGFADLLFLTTKRKTGRGHFWVAREFYGAMYPSSVFLSLFFLLQSLIFFHQHILSFGYLLLAIISIVCAGRNYIKYAFFSEAEQEVRKNWIFSAKDKFFQISSFFLYFLAALCSFFPFHH